MLGILFVICGLQYFPDHSHVPTWPELQWLDWANNVRSRSQDNPRTVHTEFCPSSNGSSGNLVWEQESDNRVRPCQTSRLQDLMKHAWFQCHPSHFLMTHSWSDVRCGRCFYVSQIFAWGEAVCQTKCKHDPECLASFAAKNGCYKAERRLSRDSRNCDDFDKEIHDRHWLRREHKEINLTGGGPCFDWWLVVLVIWCFCPVLPPILWYFAHEAKLENTTHRQTQRGFVLEFQMGPKVTSFAYISKYASPIFGSNFSFSIAAQRIIQPSTASPFGLASFPQVVYAPQWLVKRHASLLTSMTAGDFASIMWGFSGSMSCLVGTKSFRWMAPCIVDL